MAVLAAYAVPHPPLIVPGVGRGEEKKIAATIAAYEEVARRIAYHEPDTIVLLSPHAPLYRNTFALVDAKRLKGNLRQFGDQQDEITVPVDEEFCKAAQRGAHIRQVPLSRVAWHHAPMDHAAFVPLYFINRQYRDYNLVELGLSALSAGDHYKLGEVLTQTVEWLGRRVVYVASGDWSHKLTKEGPYGFAPEGPELDKHLCVAFQHNDLDALFTLDETMVERAAECGLRAFQIMAGALADVCHTSELLSYEGPFGVGYGVAALEVE